MFDLNPAVDHLMLDRELPDPFDRDAPVRRPVRGQTYGDGATPDLGPQRPGASPPCPGHPAHRPRLGADRRRAGGAADRLADSDAALDHGDRCPQDIDVGQRDRSRARRDPRGNRA